MPRCRIGKPRRRCSLTRPRLLEGLPHPAFERQLFERERQRVDRVQNLHGSMFYAEPLDVAPALLQSVVDIVNDAASFLPREPGLVWMCGGFHADFAVECLDDRQILLCFGCGEARLVTGLAHDLVDLAPDAEERLRTLLGGVRQFRPPQQFDDPVDLDSGP